MGIQIVFALFYSVEFGSKGVSCFQIPLSTQTSLRLILILSRRARTPLRLPRSLLRWTNPAGNVKWKLQIPPQVRPRNRTALLFSLLFREWKINHLYFWQRSGLPAYNSRPWRGRPQILRSIWKSTDLFEWFIISAPSRPSNTFRIVSITWRSLGE